MIDPILQSHLEPLVRRGKQCRFWASLALGWLATGLVGLALLALRAQVGATSRTPILLAVACGAAAFLLVLSRRRPSSLDWRWAARRIEAKYPALNGLLLTAAQQEPTAGGDFNYLQERLTRQALEHSAAHNWSEAVPGFRLALAHTTHLAAFGFCLAILWGLRPTPGQAKPAALQATRAGLSVTPGDTTLERGSSLVVMARFEGPVPARVDLLLSSPTGAVHRIPLVRNLADPMFGGSVPEVDANLEYHLEYGVERTRDFHVKVFEHPRLERADAGLKYPDYTRQPPKRLEDTRRLSAVEGTRLDLTLQLNKPVVSARLVPRGEETNAVPLLVESNRPAAALSQFALAASKTYQLQLVDAEGRTNKLPAQFVFEVLKNRKPEIKLSLPRGDIRPSALEEVPFAGTVWDDFGVEAYGLAYSLAGGPIKVIELGKAVPAKEKRPFEHLLSLEDLGLKPDDLVSWFVWADDIGPDGLVRRTASDLFFAEVRPFDEIFREGQGGEGQSAQQQQQSGEPSGQQGSPSAKMAELQKQIISATWKLWREHGAAPGPSPGADSKPDAGRPAPTSQTPAAPPAKAGHVAGSLLSSLRERGVLIRPAAAFGALAPAGENASTGRFFTRTIMGQTAGGVQPVAAPAGTNRAGGASTPAQSPGAKPAGFQEDAGVVRDSQAQVLEQAETSKESTQDPRLAALWEAAAKQMEKALEKLKAAEKSPALLQEALAAEQAAYQALLKLQEREYSVSRSRGQRSSQSSSRQQQMQQQLDQLELQQAENRYETERQAQAPQSPERREQLQVMNRLAELARRQQDVNERFKELQAALQEARTDQQRAELRRQLKRLQEEEQKMLADADELQQRMERPENQSRMTEQRRQMEQARQDMQRAADAAQQGAASQALASGTRAQRQMQQMRDELRRQNASEFAEDLREMRGQARELARQQDEIQKQMDAQANRQSKRLSEGDQRQELLDQLARQKARQTNLIARATQVSQETEEAEPLVSRELYDTLRKFSQDEAGSVKQMQDDLANSGTLSRGLYDRLKETGERENAKALEVTSEMLRQDMLPQAGQAGERARAGINNLRRGVERAAERVLGDDAETLRLAQRQLDQLTGQLEREISESQRAGNTNGPQQSQSTNAQPGEPSQAQAGNGRSESPRQPGQNSPQRSAEGGQRPGEQQQDQGEQGQQGQGQQGQGQQGQGQQGQGQQGQGQQGQGQQGQGQQGQGQQGQGQQGQGQQGQGQQGQGQQGQGQGDGQDDGQGNGGRQQGPGGREARDATSPSPRDGQARQNGRGSRSLRETARGNGSARAPQGGSGDLVEGRDWLSDESRLERSGPITGNDFAPWSDRLREVEEMVDQPALRNQIATARERARQTRQEYKRDLKKPDWAVVRLQVMNPLVEVRNQIADELARREPKDKLVPIDRDPVPAKYSDLVRRYYEELGKDK